MSDELIECDLVFKGGITSGIIYPLAICKLADKYRFRAIGGTSAGAIAAAAAAAAEMGRETATGGFPLLKELPGHLATLSDRKSNLEALFEPQSATKPLMEV